MIRAISLDLDDTLWPIMPVILRAENRLHEWMQEHCPEVAQQFSIEAMRTHRDQVFNDHPHLHHDYTSLRKISLSHIFADAEQNEDWVERAFEIFFAARNDVQMYHDALPALQQLSARAPLASLSNGNADLQRIGILQHFQHVVTARGFGQAKPNAPIFIHTCELLACQTHEVAHIGDDPELDVLGAQRAGLFAVWLNRNALDWPHPESLPDLTIRSLSELVDHFDSGHLKKLAQNKFAQSKRNCL